MGRSIAIKYRVELGAEVQADGKWWSHMTPSEWRTKPRLKGKVPCHGNPTDENLAKYVAQFEASTQTGGCNAHLGVQKIATAKIVDQQTGAVVAFFSAR